MILATNFTVEGEATAHYIGEMLRARGIKVSRIARGLPVGGELEHVDSGTLAQAVMEREPSSCLDRSIHDVATPACANPSRRKSAASRPHRPKRSATRRQPRPAQARESAAGRSSQRAAEDPQGAGAGRAGVAAGDGRS